MIPLPHSVEGLRAPLVTDTKGNQIRDWANAAVRGPWAGWVQPDRTAELSLNQSRVVSRYRIFLEPAASVAATDRVRVNGVVYQVDGDIEPWVTPYGVDHHEGALLKVTG